MGFRLFLLLERLAICRSTGQAAHPSHAGGLAIKE